MDIILSLFFALLFGGLCAYIAAKRQRRAIVWFFIGLLAGIFGLLVILFLPAGEQPIKGDFLNDWLNARRKEIPVLPSRAWYYVNNARERVGPISSEELQKLCNQGIIQEETLLWHKEIATWQKRKDCNLY